MSAVTKHTPGPWAWFGTGNNQNIYLATTHSGRRYVMDFTRWGMRGAQPRFQPERGGMVDAKDLLQFAVGDQSIVGIDAAKKDGSVYRYDIRGVNCADAWLIAAAPELLGALKALAAELHKNMVGGKGHLLDDALAAIRKAEGGAA